MVQKPHEVMDGIRRTYTFENGYVVSAIKTTMSYGGRKGLWEVAILTNSGDFATKQLLQPLFDYTMDDDVVGWVDDKELLRYLEVVSNA